MSSPTFQPPAVTYRMQITGISLIALVISNIFIRGPLPFSPGYQFPIKDFLAAVLTITAICEGNKAVYRYLDKKLPFDQHTTKRMVWQAVGSFLVTLAIFIPVHLIKAGLTNETISPRTLLFYGFVALSISAALNGLHLIAYLVQLLKHKQRESDAVKSPPSTLAIETGNRTLLLDPQQICWWYSTGGTVSLVKSDGAQFTTNYTSFAMIADKLPANHFFHLNRQVIAHRKSIDSVRQGQNGQLIVHLKTDHQTLQVIVSRYKKAAFQTWIEAQMSPDNRRLDDRTN